MMHTKSERDLAGLLEAHDILPTQQRLQVAQVMLTRDQHLSADQVLEALQARGAEVSKATVYNTLGLFADKGIVREVIVDPSRTFYDSNTRPHHHFYNVDEGSLKDFASDSLSIERMPQVPEGTEACGVDVVVRIRNK